MESYLPGRGLQVGLGRRLSRLYDDTKKSSDFVQEPVQPADDPEIKALHRKLRIQKDRFVSWGLEWSDSNQSAEIDESLNEAGLTNIVMSIMGTIKDILAEAEPLWLASRRPSGSERASEKAPADRKIKWDKGRFEDLVKDLTTSIDTLCDLSRTRSSVAMAAGLSGETTKPKQSIEDMRLYGSTRIRTPKQVDPRTLTSLESIPGPPLSEPEGRQGRQSRPQEVFFMNKKDYTELTQRPAGQTWSPLLVEYADFDPIYSATGVMPEMSRFERLSAGLQSESSRLPGAWIGLPLLLGYYEDMALSRLALVYSFPPTFKPVTFENETERPVDNLCTLTNLLSRPDFEPTLEAKFRLAYNLANTVFDMHSRGITHGNLNGSAISFTTSGHSTSTSTSGSTGVNEVDIRHPLVSSFDIFSKTSSTSSNTSAFLLHRHPLDPRTTSQSPLASNSETKSLDLYSLAMMLVSIGLWTALENLAPSSDSPGIPESVLGQLAIRCGTPYMRAVQACWNAVDLELSREDQADEIIRQVQIRVGGYLEACCILDGVSGLDDRLGEDILHLPPRRGRRRAALGSPSVDLHLAYPSVLTRGTSSSLALPQQPSRKTQEVYLTPESSKLQEPKDELKEKSKDEIREKPKEKPKDKPKDKPSKLRLYPQIPLPSHIVQQWNEILMPQINMALKHFYRKNPESVEISLESIGESPQKTTPTVLVVCTSVSKVRAILMKKLGILFDGTTTEISLKVCRGSMVRSRKSPRRSMKGSDRPATPRQQEDNGPGGDEETPAANPDYQEKPQNGASIGAWIGNKHLPPVSLGGVIIVDDKPYGMTVHHMLDDPEAPFQAAGKFQGSLEGAKRANASTFRSSAASQGLQYLVEGDISSESSGEDFACEFSDDESEYSVTDLTSDDEDEDEEEEFDEPGDIPGIEPGCGDVLVEVIYGDEIKMKFALLMLYCPGYIVTQPALDDVPEGFYPSSETEDEDHIDTYKVGEVYASSGIRRRMENDLVHEIDWALFEFQNERVPEKNAFPPVSADSHPATPGHLQPVEVAPAKSLPGLDVQCMARTSGCQAGRILPTLASVKIYGRTSPSHSYQVSGRIPGMSKPTTPPNQATRREVSLGIPGDSGAWVVDMLYGRLCGHILAWSERKQVAYICPMDVLLLDIAQSLEATEVRLPHGEAIVSLDDHHMIEEEEEEGWEDANEKMPHLLHQHYGTEGILAPRGDEEHFMSQMTTLERDMEKVHFG
ncbi:hypothetical protein GGS20DRAFT_574091 [Poronia punctata]|nr:hypothetical protein GGS20DRAFT_574091 [Poronia punctata]